ncbi:F-box protein SKIP23-like [Salvia miltiorrhiza]|uniref:F-box protein SKIP23-like n=1 Tax=Salvia miltiorrhiza TaxID=226208 RepID=UPI0025AC1EF1|nr:F-box protein SKIP23-like [Salvia miltiorrhiza]XP_057784657.1 F-box protein SKIP23-like [Salvia miltiorrhiza]XP_057784658.1 F-box protein SKIP23-like [Salvia miltiorrhiza]
MERPNPRIAVPWSDLPPELLDKIAKSLVAGIDVRRFRAVCRSWRSSTPPYKFPTIELPFFDDRRNSIHKHSGAYFILIERIVYRIQLPNSKNPDFWLVKLENVDNDKVRIINPVTHRKIEISPAVEMPKVLNTLDFHVSEVCKAYALRYVNPSKKNDDYYDYRYAKKVVFSANAETGEYVVMIIDLRSRLLRISSDRKKWTLFHGSVGDYNFAAARFYDVANVKGKLCAADASGDIWAFDSKFGWRIGSYDGDPAFKRRLVELCDGELVLVEEMEKVNGPCALIFRVKQPVVDVAMYAQSKLLTNWHDIKANHGCIVVVGDDCSFYIPRKELKAARVFYTDRYSFLQNEILAATGDYTCFECDCRGDVCTCIDELETVAADDEVANDDVKRMFEGFCGQDIGVYESETGETGTTLMFPEYASIFWPPPAWLTLDASS